MEGNYGSAAVYTWRSSVVVDGCTIQSTGNGGTAVWFASSPPNLVKNSVITGKKWREKGLKIKEILGMA